MVRSRSVIAGISLLLLVSGAPLAWATIDNLKGYKAAYPNKDPKAYSCRTCHDGAVGNTTNLNAYAKALKRFKADQGAKELTPKDFKAFDAADSDNDGATNAQEISAGTDPFDPASKPAGGASAAPASAVPTVKKDDVGAGAKSSPSASQAPGETK